MKSSSKEHYNNHTHRTEQEDDQFALHLQQFGSPLGPDLRIAHKKAQNSATILRYFALKNGLGLNR